MLMREVVITAVLSAAVVVGTAIAATQHDHDAAAAAAPAQQAGAMMDHQKMMADMNAEQAKLDDLVAQMNAATGPAKVDRIAAAVTELAAMHKHMNTMMQGDMMHGGMMQGGMKMHGAQTTP